VPDAKDASGNGGVGEISSWNPSRRSPPIFQLHPSSTLHATGPNPKPLEGVLPTSSRRSSVVHRIIQDSSPNATRRRARLQCVIRAFLMTCSILNRRCYLPVFLEVLPRYSEVNSETDSGCFEEYIYPTEMAPEVADTFFTSTCLQRRQIQNTEEDGFRFDTTRELREHSVWLL
jgi:hypothetical protein